MSDISINTTLRGTSSMPSRSVSSSGGGGGSVSTPSPIPVPGQLITSPKGTIDSNSGMFVVQFRDNDGKVTMQYPAPQASSAYKQGAAVNSSAAASQGGGHTSSAPAPQAQSSASASAPAPSASASAMTKTDSA